MTSVWGGERSLSYGVGVWRRPLLRRVGRFAAGQGGGLPVAGGEGFGGVQHFEADHAAVLGEVQGHAGGDFFALGNAVQVGIGQADIGGVGFGVIGVDEHGGVSRGAVRRDNSGCLAFC